MDDDQSCSTTGGGASVAIDLAIDDPAWLTALPGATSTARAALTAALDAACPGCPAEVTLVLADDGRVRDLNRAWRGIDRATNVLSFPSVARRAGEAPQRDPGDPPDATVGLGDIIVARETLMREACEAGRPADHHLSHLVVHGTLHLLGYDHDDDGDAEVMEALECDVLAGIGVPDPYR
ncbi:MAG: rRNA maturation RNase YbeY [Rhodospirillales bacterium]|nr:rRNA maturation RNase YbeY [Rhodospirillales bacterium]